LIELDDVALEVERGAIDDAVSQVDPDGVFALDDEAAERSREGSVRRGKDVVIRDGDGPHGVLEHEHERVVSVSSGVEQDLCVRGLELASDFGELGDERGA
jgi:hypothetical protein